jgi:hypothetical protein
LVTLRKITLGRRFLSDALFVNGTSRLVMNTNRCGRLASMRLRNFRPGSPIGTVMMARSSWRSRSYKYCRKASLAVVLSQWPATIAAEKRPAKHTPELIGWRLLQIVVYGKRCRIGGKVTLDDLAETSEIGDWKMPYFRTRRARVG